MSTFMKIFAALLLAIMLSVAPGIANARGGHGGGGHGGGGHGGHFHGGGGHFHGGHFHGGFGGWGWGWGYPYYYGGYYDPYYYSDSCHWVRVRVWRGDHWRYRRIRRCWY
jgi:hypothetical protein